MSLTKKQWNEMWNEIINIEDLNKSIKLQDKPRMKYQARCTHIENEIKKLKELIQSVLVQMS